MTGRINLELVELLGDRTTLFEVNVVVDGDTRHVEVLYTDPRGDDSKALLSQEAAGTLGEILQKFDWRALVLLGHALADGAVMLGEDDR